MWKYQNTDELYHYGILGMKWGVRRFQNKDGSLTPEGKKVRKAAIIGGSLGALSIPMSIRNAIVTNGGLQAMSPAGMTLKLKNRTIVSKTLIQAGKVATIAAIGYYSGTKIRDTVIKNKQKKKK